MKKIITAVLLMATISANAQSDKYMDKMKYALTMFDSAKTLINFSNTAREFEIIGKAEKTQWLPYYWAGIVMTKEAWKYLPDDKGVVEINTPNKTRNWHLANLAYSINNMLHKADSLAVTDEDKSEILAAHHIVATQQMLVDPEGLYSTLGVEAEQDLQKAMKLNPNNPRVYYLQGMDLFRKPAAFGGGKEKAKPLFEKAIALFKTEHIKPLYPHWGQKQAEDMLAQCQ